MLFPFTTEHELWGHSVLDLSVAKKKSLSFVLEHSWEGGKGLQFSCWDKWLIKDLEDLFPHGKCSHPSNIKAIFQFVTVRMRVCSLFQRSTLFHMFSMRLGIKPVFIIWGVLEFFFHLFIQTYVFNNVLADQLFTAEHKRISCQALRNKLSSRGDFCPTNTF